MKKIMIVSLCMVALLVTGCGKIAKLENGEEVVVSINGENITANDLYNQIKDKYGRDVLINMVDTIILDKTYKTDDYMTNIINKEVDYYKGQLGENFLPYIKSEIGLNSEQELFTYFLLDYKRSLAIKDYVKNTVTDKEIKDYYKKETVGDIKASHILIQPNVTDGMTSEEITAKEKEAEDLAKELIKKLNNGDDFAKLAKEYGSDGTASKGGDLGWFNKGVMDEAFEKAAFALKKDEYTLTPVKSSFGYHLILKTGEKDKPALDEVKDSVIEDIATNKLSEGNTALPYKALQELRKKHDLKIDDSELKKQYDSYMKELLAK
ncbi:MAG: peptidylprolyl isomerase [Bacilli bacterium]|nr:peptidylprolyl isomerase [Bacilli bacterium]